MQKNKKHEIDLTGRKMWYEPWPVNEDENYKQPSEQEIDETYGIPGDTFNETLLYYEECGGNTDQLLKLLNEHTPDDKFHINREALIDKSRWYNCEYYFYFIMFTKKLIGRYDFRYGENNNVKLSKYHRPFEKPCMNFNPWGDDSENNKIGDIDGFIIDFSYHHTKSLIKSKERKIIFDNELISFLRSFLHDKYKSTFTISFIQNESNFYSMGFAVYFNSFCQVFSNWNNLNRAEVNKNLIDRYLKYNIIIMLRSYSIFGMRYLLESVINKVESTYYYEVNKSAKTSISFNQYYKKDFINKYRDYDYLQFYLSTTLAGIPNSMEAMLGIMYKIDKGIIVEIEKYKYDIEKPFKIYCKWKLKKRKNLLIKFIPLLTLPLLFLFPFKHSFIILFSILFAGVTALSIYLNKIQNKLDDKQSVWEDNHHQFNENLLKMENIADELIKEKNKLEENVIMRTSELSRANEKLKELDILKSRFFTNISHEFRTPITIISGFIKSIMSGNYGNTIKTKDKIFKTIHRNSIRLLKLINNILDFNKIGAKKYKVNREKVDIKKLLKIYISMFESAIEKNNLLLSFIDNTETLIANLDVYLFETVILNLLSNAIKFTETGGRITVSLKKEKNNFTISIQDTGIGIPQDMQEIIFERFKQIDDSPNRKHEGSGIGLALVKEIIELFNGKISLDSKPGKGSTFIIQISNPPFSDNIKIKEIAMHNAGYFDDLIIDDQDYSDDINLEEDKYSILLVEDNLDMQDYIISILKSNFIIQTANNGLDALNKLLKIKIPDLIISDIMMPEMDGMEFHAKLADIDNFKNIPFIYLTARSDLEERIQALKRGAIDYIEKPFDKNELSAKINSVLHSFSNANNQIINNIIYEAQKNLKKNAKENAKDDILEKYKITIREKEIIDFIIAGKENKGIAGELNISVYTVGNHIQNIYKKLKVSNRISLVKLFS